jgi:hypothetical protein
MLVVSLNHSEQVVRSVLLMGEDEAPQAPAMRNAMIEAPADICRDALLPTLENKGSNAACSMALFF